MCNVFTCKSLHLFLGGGGGAWGVGGGVCGERVEGVLREVFMAAGSGEGGGVSVPFAHFNSNCCFLKLLLEKNQIRHAIPRMALVRISAEFGQSSNRNL